VLLVEIGTGEVYAPYLRLPAALCDIGSGSKSISLWFKLTRNDIGYQYIFMQGHSYDGTNYNPFCIEQNNQLTTIFTVYDGDWRTGTASSPHLFYGVPSVNVWHHAVTTIGGGVVAGYLDGVLVNTATYSGDIISHGDSNTLGFSQSGPSGYNQEVSTPAQIHVDELGIWNRVLSSSEVSILYNNGDGIPFTISSAPTLSPTLSPTISPSLVPSQTPTLVSTLTKPNPKGKPKRRPTPKPTRRRYIYRTHSPSKRPTTQQQP
jgi:hypothetical protein